jgi:hypothetical protein
VTPNPSVKELAGRNLKSPRLSRGETSGAEHEGAAELCGPSLNVVIQLPTGSKCVNSPPTDQEIASSPRLDEWMNL